MLFNVIMFVLFVMWLSASSSDTTMLANATEACKEDWESLGSSYTCESEVYGVTIAIDVAMSALVAIFVALWDKSGGQASREQAYASPPVNTIESVV